MKKHEKPETKKQVKKPIKISSRKAKSRKLQDWIAEQISKLLNIPYGHSDDMLIEGRPMNQKGVDVILRGEALNRFPFSIEAKAVEKLNIDKAIKQVKTNMYTNTDWLVFHKKNRENPIVIMDALKFFDIIKNYRESL